MRGSDPRGHRILVVPHLVLAADTRAYPASDEARTHARIIATATANRADIGLMAAPMQGSEDEVRDAQLETLARDLADYLRDGYAAGAITIAGLPGGGIFVDRLQTALSRRGERLAVWSTGEATDAISVGDGIDLLMRE